MISLSEFFVDPILIYRNGDYQMAKKLHEIPTIEDFLKGLEKIKSQQLEARESSKQGVYPFEGSDNKFSHYTTGIITPKEKHYLINGDGDLSFTGTKFLIYEDKEAFPPFSAAEMLLESKNDFNIDFVEAAKYYNLNKELAMKENENILSSKEYKPDHAISLTINQEMKEVKTLLEDLGQDPSKNPEVSSLLDQHFSKVEKLLTDFTEKIEKSPHEDLPQLEENSRGKLTKIFSDLKDGIKQLFVDMKEQVRSGIDNKVNDIKVNINNAVAEKVQVVNDKIKNLTASLDEKYQIIEKQPEKAKEVPKQEVKNEDSALKETDTPDLGQIKKENNQLKKENDGLKTFVNVVKSKHPEVYQAIYNTMKGVQQGEQEQEKTEMKPKEKEAELQL